MLEEKGMKSNGDAMETTVAVPEPSSTQEATLEQAPSQPEPADDAVPATNLKANGKPLAVEPKMKPKVDFKKPVTKSTGAAANNLRPGAASQRSVNDVKSLNNVSVKKTTTAAKSSAAAGAVPKKPMGIASVSTAARIQAKTPEKKPVGQSTTITNGTKPAAVNGSAKMRPASEAIRAKTAGKRERTEQRCLCDVPNFGNERIFCCLPAPSRPAASSGPKPSSSTATKAGVVASAKTNKYVCRTLGSVHLF